MTKQGRYPKLIDPQFLAFDQEIDLKQSNPDLKQKNNSSLNKQFFYVIALVFSLAIVALLLVLGNLSDPAVESISNFLSTLPLVELKLSKALIKDLRLPNPVSSTIFVGNFLFVSFALIDIFRKENLQRGHFKESSSLSFSFHVAVLLILLVTLLLSWQPKPKVQVTQIEFIPTQIPSKKKPPAKTKRRAAKQSIDQDRHNPKKKIKAPTKPPGKPGLPAQKSKPQAKSKPKPAAKAKPKRSPAKPKPAPPKLSKPSPKPKSFKPQPKLDRESIKRAERTNSQSRSLPKLMNYSPGQSQTTATSSNSSAPPSPKSSGGTGSSNSNIVSRLSTIPRAPDSISGQGGGYGSEGNPGPNPYGGRPPSVAAQADINFGPYMSSLQRKIKRAWKPPRGTESNRIVVTFTVQADGKLTGLKLVQASGIPEANMAALQAVSRAAPFDPLPRGAGSSVDIEFTFDYNVFQRTRF